jgi:carbonic anhydrase
MSSLPTTATDAWSLLMTGNRNFVAGTPQRLRQGIESGRAVANAQRPFAALFGCSDSRVSAELIFDVGLGDLFVIRNAGQVIAETILGSLEFAVEVLRVPIILVLGHDACGAIKATVDSLNGELKTEGEFIRNLVNRISPTITKSMAQGRVSIDELTADHITVTIDEILERSSLIANRVREGKVAIVGASYRLEIGEVQRLVSRGQL